VGFDSFFDVGDQFAISDAFALAVLWTLKCYLEFDFSGLAIAILMFSF
jgi:hypothetical protein